MRELIPGSRLDQIVQSDRRYPAYKVLLHNPRCTTFAQVATNTYEVPPFDASPFVKSVGYEENIGHENLDDPSTTRISIEMQRHPTTGITIRRGLIEDGVIVQVFEGDARIPHDEWVCVFTGRFRGRPGDDPGTPAEKTEGFTATAYGREEGYLNVRVPATISFPNGTDLGEMAQHIGSEWMGLTMDEMLFGSLDFQTQHLTNQLVDINALTAMYQLGFPTGKKPKFDSLGRLRFVDVNLDKPACRVYTDRALFRAMKAAPNEIEVNNSVVIRGLSAVLTKALGEIQRLLSFEAITGFFDSNYDEDKWFSEDHSQRAQDTYLVTKHKISWSDADWTQVDEFHGDVDIECRTLYYARVIIFATYLALQVAVAAIDLIIQSGAPGSTPIVTPSGPSTLAVWREILYILSIVALAGLLWSMQFIGRGSYEIWGKPFEYVYQELMVRVKMIGLDESSLREIEYRNDFLSDIEVMQTLATEHLRREMLKNQTYELVMMNDPFIEVDDVIEVNGERHYVVSVTRTLEINTEPIMALKTWLIHKNVLADAQHNTTEDFAPEQSGGQGYGMGYAEFYGEQL